MSKLKLIGFSCMLALAALSGPAFAQYMYLDVDGDSLNTSADRLNADGATVLTIYLNTNHDRDGSLQTCNSHTVGCGASTTTQSLDMFGYTISLVAVGGTVQWGTFTPADAAYAALGSDVMDNQSIEINRIRPTGTTTPAGLFALGTISVTIESDDPHIEIAHGPTTADPSGFGTGFATDCDGYNYSHTYVLGDMADPCGSAGDWFDADGTAGALVMVMEGPNSNGEGPSSPATDTGCPQSVVACDWSNKPSVYARPGKCAGPPPLASTDTLRYIIQDLAGHPKANCEVTVVVTSDLASEVNTGGHCHNVTNRPIGTHTPVSGYNTGEDGLQLRIVHTWSEVAGRYHVTVTTVAGSPCGAVQGIYTICVRKENSFLAGLEALVDGPGYELTGGPDNVSRHPDHHYGTHAFIAAIQATAKEFADSVPGARLLGLNDMSLRWGGVFDINTATEWQPDHCGHRFGTNCDLRTHEVNGSGQTVPVYTGDQIALLERILLRRKIFPYKHKPGGGVFPHWHLQPLKSGGLE